MTRTEFISVEIALHSDDESAEWIAYFDAQENHMVKVSGTDTKWFIYFAPLPFEDADATIQALCTQIESLPDSVKACWDNAVRREFFVGYQTGFEWPCLDNRLSNATLAMMVRLNAELMLAIYPANIE